MMNASNTEKFSKRAVAAAFSRVAGTYDKVAYLQSEVGDRLLQRLDLIQMAPQMILDVGSATGRVGRLLSQRFPAATVLALDIAEGMVQFASRQQKANNKQHFLCADCDYLPMQSNSVDLIVSNLTVQWCHHLEQTFIEFYRVLRPGGCVIFTTLGPDTLKELRACWQTIDDYRHVNEFIDMHLIGDDLLRGQFVEPVMDREILTLTYRSVMTLMQDLKKIGAHNMNTDRRLGLTGKQQMNALLQSYEQYKDARDLFPATYEVIYGIAWKKDFSHAPKQERAMRTISVPIEVLKTKL